MASIHPNQKKSVLDCWHGYHSLKLMETASDATIFITEWGRYRYKRAPQGFHASGNGYTNRTDDITDGVTNHKTCISDNCMYSDSIE